MSLVHMSSRVIIKSRFQLECQFLERHAHNIPMFLLAYVLLYAGSKSCILWWWVVLRNVGYNEESISHQFESNTEICESSILVQEGIVVRWFKVVIESCCEFVDLCLRLYAVQRVAVMITKNFSWFFLCSLSCSQILRQIRQGKQESLFQCLEREYRLSVHAVNATHSTDFYEVRPFLLVALIFYQFKLLPG